MHRVSESFPPAKRTKKNHQDTGGEQHERTNPRSPISRRWPRNSACQRLSCPVGQFQARNLIEMLRVVADDGIVEHQRGASDLEIKVIDGDSG